MPVREFVAPGPSVAMAIAARPVSRPWTSAMNAAPCSWRVVMWRTASWRDNASRMSIVSSPGTLKTYSAHLGREAIDEEIGSAPRVVEGHAGKRRVIDSADEPSSPRDARPDLIGQIVDESMRVGGSRHGDPRAGDAPPAVEAGLPTDAAGRVLFPRPVVEKAIADAPRSVALFDRDGKPHADLSEIASISCRARQGSRRSTIRTGEVRLANSTDFVEYVRLADGLQHIAYLATAFSTNDDIEARCPMRGASTWCSPIRRSRWCRARSPRRGVPRMVEMMQLFRADLADLIARPMSIFTITATGNFRYSEDSCQNLIDCVEAGSRSRLCRSRSWA